MREGRVERLCPVGWLAGWRVGGSAGWLVWKKAMLLREQGDCYSTIRNVVTSLTTTTTTPAQTDAKTKKKKKKDKSNFNQAPTR